jgi:hypothetical protein
MRRRLRGRNRRYSLYTRRDCGMSSLLLHRADCTYDSKLSGVLAYEHPE